MRFPIVAALLGAVAYGEDITLALDGGEIFIRNGRFIRVAESGSYVAELSFKIENHTSVPWWTVALQFNIVAMCNGTPRHWSIPATTSLGWSEDHIVGNVYGETYDPLEGKVHGCRRVVGPEQAKKEAAEKARRTRELSEAAQKQSEDDAKAAEERQRTRAACTAIYQRTVDKKIGEPTVREGEQIRGCQAAVGGAFVLEAAPKARRPARSA